jgi:hypothetical protein
VYFKQQGEICIEKSKRTHQQGLISIEHTMFFRHPCSEWPFSSKMSEGVTRRRPLSSLPSPGANRKRGREEAGREHAHHTPHLERQRPPTTLLLHPRTSHTTSSRWQRCAVEIEGLGCCRRVLLSEGSIREGEQDERLAAASPLRRESNPSSSSAWVLGPAGGASRATC